MPPAHTLRSAAALADAGLIAPERLPALERVAAQYAVAITADMAALIEPANEADPIARQFVPQVAELVSAPGEDPDPIGDLMGAVEDPFGDGTAIDPVDPNQGEPYQPEKPAEDRRDSRSEPRRDDPPDQRPEAELPPEKPDNPLFF